MPKYVIRLIIAFAAFIGIFLVLRHYLTPDSFGDLGHYRADAIDEIKNLPTKYMGRETCVMCHDDIDTVIVKGHHAKINCETCHGPGYLHSEDPKPENIERNTERKFCGKCHFKNASRPGFMKQIDPAEHNPEGECVECHNPHEPLNF